MKISDSQEFSNAVKLLIAAQGNEGAAKTLLARGLMVKPRITGSHPCEGCNKKISANKTHCLACQTRDALLRAAGEQATKFEGDLDVQIKRIAEGKKLVQLVPPTKQMDIISRPPKYGMSETVTIDARRAVIDLIEDREAA